MSSLRNAVKRVTHKERSQPRARTHLGLLEKKKDYKRRAKDFHFKTDLIQKMKVRASMRNPDEFYFGMKSALVKDGRHTKTQQVQNKERDAEIGAEAVRIMKDQDLSYIRMQKQKDTKKMERLKANLHLLESTNDEPQQQRHHAVFVDTARDAAKFDVAEHFDTVPALAGRSFNRPRLETLEQAAAAAATHTGVAVPKTTTTTTTKTGKLTVQGLDRASALDHRVAKKVAKARAASYRELEERAHRVSVLAQAEAHLVTEKLLAGKGRKRKIKAAEDGQPAQYKWRRKRAS
jgi:U3 small nucleolar RNA-associated protein 11